MNAFHQLVGGISFVLQKVASAVYHFDCYRYTSAIGCIVAEGEGATGGDATTWILVVYRAGRACGRWAVGPKHEAVPYQSIGRPGLSEAAAEGGCVTAPPIPLFLTPSVRST